MRHQIKMKQDPDNDAVEFKIQMKLTQDQIADMFGDGDFKQGILKLREAVHQSMRNEGFDPRAKGKSRTAHNSLEDMPPVHRERARRNAQRAKSGDI